MAVTLNKTDGTVLTTIDDGGINTDKTDLTLIGRLYRNYGELVNENFIRLLENFANSSAPLQAIVGQLWYNTSTGTINVRRDNGFVGLSVLTTSSAQPNQPRSGDLWFDTVDAQLKMFNGTTWLVITPSYTTGQAKSGVFVETIRDVLNTEHICIVSYQQGSVTAIHCRDPEWTPSQAISGFISVKPGFNLAQVYDQQFQGNASNAVALGNVTADKYLRNDLSGSIDGGLTLATDGLTIGEFDDLKIYVEGSDAYIAKNAGRTSVVSGLSTIVTFDESGQALFADGEETTPVIAFASDTNTGIHHPDQNMLNVVIGGVTIGEFSEGGLFINGNIQASNFGGLLNAQSITTGNLVVTNSTTLNSLNVTGNTILGDANTDILTIRGTGVSIPNGLTFSNNTVTFNGGVRFAGSISSTSGNVNIVSPLTVSSDLVSTGSLTVEGSLTADVLVKDAGGRLRLNSAVATGYASMGDFTMGSTNGIRSYNSPKMWIAFNGTLAGLAVYDSFHIDFITRTSANHYSFTTEFPISSGAMAVIGTNDAALTAAPSIGATSFSITTSSEGTRMALVVLSQ